MTQLSTIDWPPPYQIKKHRKAKYVKLRTDKSKGLLITVPYRFNLKQLPAILEEHRAWITKQLLALQSQQTDELPLQIEMRAINVTWKILYMTCQTKLELIRRPENEIVLLGKTHDINLCKRKLIEWIRQEASIHLNAQLTSISKQTKLPYKCMTIRDQQTRWGSCSSEKSINLSYKLLFLPSELMRHVLIHELCHTKHLNHSDQFWNLVATHDPNWQINRRALKRANQYIPGWL